MLVIEQSLWTTACSIRYMYEVKFFVVVKRQILRYQDPVTGLFPCDLSKPNEAHVRDSVYCSAAAWALSQAYK